MYYSACRSRSVKNQNQPFADVSQNSLVNTCDGTRTKGLKLYWKRLQHGWFSENIANVLRKTFSQNTSGRLLLRNCGEGYQLVIPVCIYIHGYEKTVNCLWRSFRWLMSIYKNLNMSNFKGPLLVVGMFLTTEYPLKWGKMFFISFKKLFTFLRLSLSSFLKFRSFLGYVEKHFDKMSKINFRIYDVKEWKANTCNTHIVQYLNK